MSCWHETEKSVKELTCLTAFHRSEQCILWISKLSETAWNFCTITVNLRCHIATLCSHLQSLNNQGWRNFWCSLAQTLSQSRVNYGARTGCSGLYLAGPWNLSKTDSVQPLCTTCPSAWWSSYDLFSAIPRTSHLSTEEIVLVAFCWTRRHLSAVCMPLSPVLFWIISGKFY